MKDLLLLVADKNAQFALKGALARPAALGIRGISFDVRVHVGRDGGARKSGPEMLALERRRFTHALLVLDFEGSGAEQPDALGLEAELDVRLAGDWEERAKSIVISPELDIWMWGSSNALRQILEWSLDQDIRDGCGTGASRSRQMVNHIVRRKPSNWC
jgi:hypothetical protein